METFDAEAGAALKSTVESIVREWQGVTVHTLFGHPSYEAGGTIFALLRTDGVVLTRLPDAERERLGARYEAGPFEAGGQTIDSWVHVPVGADDVDGLLPFLRASHAAALSESRPVPPPADED